MLSPNAQRTRELGYPGVVEIRWHVGDVIEKLRKDRRWNQVVLGKHARLNKATIVRVEENATGIKRETYEAIARAFGITVGQLFSLIPPSTPAPEPSFRYTGPDRRQDNRESKEG